jgi:hypothetical protein
MLGMKSEALLEVFTCPLSKRKKKKTGAVFGSKIPTVFRNITVSNILMCLGTTKHCIINTLVSLKLLYFRSIEKINPDLFSRTEKAIYINTPTSLATLSCHRLFFSHEQDL